VNRLISNRREILAIALPAIVANVTTPLLGLADVAITGHIGASLYISAIAVGGSIFNMLYWLFDFLRMGTTGFTAQAVGAGDSLRCRLTLYRGIFLSLILGMLLIAFSHPVANAVLDFMDADAETAALARQYFNICIFGAPAVMVTYAMSGWFLGMQNSKAQMWVAIITNVVNIIVSLTLVFGLDMKIDGIATGTLAAQWSGAALAAAIVAVRYRPDMPPLRLIFETRPLLRFFRVNTDIFLRTVCLVAVTLWFTHAGALQGNGILAANAILMQFFMLFSFFMDGFAFAAEALGGKYTGRADSSALSSLIRSLMAIGLAGAVIFGIVYAGLGNFIISLLSDSADVRCLAGDYLPWAAAIPLCGFLAFLWDGIFVGLVRTREMLLSMAVAMAVFFSMYFAVGRSMSNHGLWLAFDTYLLTRGLVQWMLYAKIKKC